MEGDWGRSLGLEGIATAKLLVLGRKKRQIVVNCEINNEITRT